MVTPEEDIQEEEIVEVREEVQEVISSTKASFDFSVASPDRPGLTVYTVSTKPAEEEWKTLKILAPSYATALGLASLSSDHTILLSDVPFEG